MGRPTMITLVLMASMFVVVKCCESNDECENGCCYRGTCSQTILCDLQKRLERLKTCVFDSDCSTGCCGSDGKCKAGYDYGYGCSPHSSCSFNWDCPGAQCCENGRCEDSATQCTFRVPIPISTTQFSWLDRFNIKTSKRISYIYSVIFTVVYGRKEFNINLAVNFAHDCDILTLVRNGVI